MPHKDIESDDVTSCQSNPGLSAALFLQAVKSTLHFSAVTSLKSQKLGISIKTRYISIYTLQTDIHSNWPASLHAHSFVCSFGHINYDIAMCLGKPFFWTNKKGPFWRKSLIVLVSHGERESLSSEFDNIYKVPGNMYISPARWKYAQISKWIHFESDKNVLLQ